MKPVLPALPSFLRQKNCSTAPGLGALGPLICIGQYMLLKRTEGELRWLPSNPWIC